MLFIQTLFSLLLLCHVSCFGFYGHKLGAMLLWKLLATPTRQRILALTHTRRRFLILAVWPDLVKHRHDMRWAQSLHFLNTRTDSPPRRCQRTFFAEIRRRNNVVGGVFWAAQRLGSAATPHHTRMFLSFFVHLMMDLHNPMHMTSHLDGGNRLRVRYGRRTMRLHAVWDTGLVQDVAQRAGGSQRLVRRLYLRSRRCRCTETSVRRLVLAAASTTSQINCRAATWSFTTADAYVRANGRVLEALLVRFAVCTGAYLNRVLV